MAAQVVAAAAAAPATPRPFYLNCIVRDATQVIEDAVDKKVGKGRFGLARRAAKAVAKAAVKDNVVATKLAAELQKRVPAACAEMGIEVAVESRYLNGPLCVLRLTLGAVDARAMLHSTKGKEWADRYDELMACLVFFGIDAAGKIEEKISAKVSTALMEKLEASLPAKLGSAGLVVDVATRLEAEQSEWHYALMQEMGN